MLTFFEETHFCNFKTKKKNTIIKKFKQKIIIEQITMYFSLHIDYDIL